MGRKPNGWPEYEKLFLYEMKENAKRFDKVFDALTTLQTDVNGLKVKAALVGGMAGLVGTGIVSAILQLWK